MVTESFIPDFAAAGNTPFQPDHPGAGGGAFTPAGGPVTAGVVIPPRAPLDLDELAQQGFEEGFAAGERAGLEVGREKAVSYLNAIAETLGDLTELRRQIYREAHEELVALAVAVAERLVRRELTIDRSLLLERVQDFLTELDDPTSITLRMHPLDLAYAESCQEEWRHLFSAVGQLRLEETHDLQQGDIRIETPTTSLDARIDTLLATARERLLEAIRTLPQGGPP
ncbi:MAG TPA: FliH/SctL family protein [bacterium]|jgi:flagellar assembly protein FliH